MAENFRIDPKCLQESNDSIIKVKENKASYSLDNDQRLRVGKVHVDGCLINEGERCDYLFTVEERNANILIELKGKDVEKAIKQIKTSFLFFSKVLEGVFFGRIITSGTYAPALESNESKRLKRLLLQAKGNLKSSTGSMVEKVSLLSKGS